MNITTRTNNKAKKALNKLQSFREMEEELHMNLSMVHGVANKPLNDEQYKKVQEYNQEVERELKAHFDKDSVEYMIRNQIPF